MDKSAVVEIVDRFRRGLEARGIRPQKVILYGSYATGVATAVSDIDVVVISSDFSGKGYWERVEVMSDVIYEIFAPLDVYRKFTTTSLYSRFSLYPVFWQYICKRLKPRNFNR